MPGQAWPRLSQGLRRCVGTGQLHQDVSFLRPLQCPGPALPAKHSHPDTDTERLSVHVRICSLARQGLMLFPS